MSVVPVDREDLKTLLAVAGRILAMSTDTTMRDYLMPILGRYQLGIDSSESREIVTDLVSLNIGDVRVTFYEPGGLPLRRGGIATKFRAMVEIDGLESNRIIGASFDEIDYSKNETFLVHLKILPSLPIDQAAIADTQKFGAIGARDLNS
jgi:hypothetical protein